MDIKAPKESELPSLFMTEKEKEFYTDLMRSGPFSSFFSLFFFFFYKYFQLDLHELKGCLTPRFHSRETNEKEPP